MRAASICLTAEITVQFQQLLQGFEALRMYSFGVVWLIFAALVAFHGLGSCLCGMSIGSPSMRCSQPRLVNREQRLGDDSFQQKAIIVPRIRIGYADQNLQPAQVGRVMSGAAQ
jgi:hypothetical protein